MISDQTASDLHCLLKCMISYLQGWIGMIWLYLKSGQVLKLCQVSELKVQRVDADEGQDVQDVEEEPDDEHQDVVSKDHVVDDAWNED